MKSYTSNALIDMVEILFSRKEVPLKMCLKTPSHRPSMEVARSGLWVPGWYVCSKLRYWAYFSQQSVATEYLHLTEDNNRGRKDYYLDPHDSDPTVPVTRADVCKRLVLF